MIRGGLLESLQASLARYLLGLNDFRGVPIIPHRQSDIDSVVRSTIDASAGLAIIILPPAPVDVIPNAAGPVFRRITCEIRVVENLATNRTGRGAISVAEKVMQHLHLWRPEIFDWNDELALSSGAPWKSTQDGDSNTIAMQFETHYSLESMES
jgi:hypothetical protein